MFFSSLNDLWEELDRTSYSLKICGYLLEEYYNNKEPITLKFNIIK